MDQECSFHIALKQYVCATLPKMHLHYYVYNGDEHYVIL